jgi:hypothetical protein
MSALTTCPLLVMRVAVTHDVVVLSPTWRYRVSHDTDIQQLHQR